MGVTFTAELGPVVGFAIACCRGAADSAPRYGNFADARADFIAVRERFVAAGAPLAGCDFPEVCPEYQIVHIMTIEADDAAPEVSVSIGNVGALLYALGLPQGEDDVVDVGGSMDAPTFLGAVLIALAVAPSDSGVPSYELGGQGMRFIECGRRPGWLQDQLTSLLVLAEWCVERKRDVHWH